MKDDPENAAAGATIVRAIKEVVFMMRLFLKRKYFMTDIVVLTAGVVVVGRAMLVFFLFDSDDVRMTCRVPCVLVVPQKNRFLNAGSRRFLISDEATLLNLLIVLGSFSINFW